MIARAAARALSRMPRNAEKSIRSNFRQLADDPSERTITIEAPRACSADAVWHVSPPHAEVPSVGLASTHSGPTIPQNWSSRERAARRFEAAGAAPQHEGGRMRQHALVKQALERDDHRRRRAGDYQRIARPLAIDAEDSVPEPAGR
ncbi:hypothetical protein [Methylorubrum zatmanii]